MTGYMGTKATYANETLNETETERQEKETPRCNSHLIHLAEERKQLTLADNSTPHVM